MGMGLQVEVGMEVRMGMWGVEMQPTFFPFETQYQFLAPLRCGDVGRQWERGM